MAAGTNASAILRRTTETAEAKVLFISFAISGIIRDNDAFEMHRSVQDIKFTQQHQRLYAKAAVKRK